MQAWRSVWRVAARLLSDDALAALRQGVADDAPELIQGATCTPPPLQCIQDWPCEGACLLGYGEWKAGHADKVADVEEAFAHLCYQIDWTMGEPAACRWLLNWFDDTPRVEMRQQLLPEIDRELRRREGLRAVSVCG